MWLTPTPNLEVYWTPPKTTSTSKRQYLRLLEPLNVSTSVLQHPSVMLTTTFDAPPRRSYGQSKFLAFLCLQSRRSCDSSNLLLLLFLPRIYLAHTFQPCLVARRGWS
eukprot:COSAG01_NODE_3763_length_5720_cov_3.247109_3_plen_108_part_00